VQKAWTALAQTWSGAYQPLDAAPDALIEALTRLQTAILDHLADAERSDTAPGAGEPSSEDGPARLTLTLLAQATAGSIAESMAEPTTGRRPPPTLDLELQTLLFDTLAFTRLAASFGTHSVYELLPPAAETRPARGARHTEPQPRLQLRNLLPAPFLAPRFEVAQGVLLFSATLSPPAHHQRLLGLPEGHGWLDLPSPFPPEHLQVAVAPWLSTRYADRAASLTALVDLIGATCSQAPGNHLAFFASFDYLEQTAAALRERWPGLPLITQRRGLSEAAQAEFLAAFLPGGRVLGLAVLGGAFAEGVDLPGDRLHGAFIATLGLPQFNAENETLKQALDRLLGPGQGHDATYLVPGLQKVVQAAGRVIRSPTDRGFVWLLDDRYQRPEVQALLPSWWRMTRLPRPSPPPPLVTGSAHPGEPPEAEPGASQHE
jgi:DNA excision repair protein ERCC-2